MLLREVIVAGGAIEVRRGLRYLPEDPRYVG